jgi:perosamine synthetase
MPNPLAALGYSQMQRLDEMNRTRVRLANRYNDLLAERSPVVETPYVHPQATHVYQMYTILLPQELRDATLLHLRANGVGASAHFDPPVHVQPYYVDELGWKRGDLPVTERLAQRLITLPIYPDMTEDDQNWVVHALKLALAEVTPS